MACPSIPAHTGKTSYPVRPGAAVAFLFLAAAALPAAEPEPAMPIHGIPELPPGDDMRLRLFRKKPHPAEFTLSGIYFLDLGGDARHHKGWGGAAEFMLLPYRMAEYPNWQMKLGLEGFGFHTTGHYTKSGTRYKESMDTGAFNILAGGSYFPCQYVELGAFVGIGFAGTYRERRDPSKTKQDGNANWMLQFKPTLSFYFGEHASASIAYRFGYITPVVRADLVGYKSVDILSQSIEVGLRWRF